MLQLTDRNELHLAVSGQSGQGFQIQFLVTGDDGQDHPVQIAFDRQCLENLFWRQSDLLGNFDGPQVLGIHFVLAQFIRNAEFVELPGGVRLHGGFAGFCERIIPRQGKCHLWCSSKLGSSKS